MCITDKIRESRLRWYGHVQRREDDHCIKRILKAEVYGRQSWKDKGRAKINTISQQGHGRRLPQPGQLMIGEELLGYHNNNNHLTRPHQPEPHTSGVDAEDRDGWRRRTRVADPSPVGFTA